MSAIERKYHYLWAELAELDNLLTMTPESALIDRKTIEHRRNQVAAELERNPPPHRWPASARLGFNGKPVVDQQEIYADFAGSAVDAFTEALTSLAASKIAALGERGVIPNREDYRLLVTGTSSGSFGFDIEEVLEPQATYLDEESPVASAIGQAKGILESLIGDEEALADAIADTDERALRDFRDFLKVMVDHEAVCSLSFNNQVFRFRDIGQVQRGLESLSSDNIHEDERDIVGYFQGFLPKVRRAEFVDRESAEVISCRVDRAVDNAEGINRILGKDVNLHVRSRRVRNSRPRYTILSFGLNTIAE